MSASFLQLGKNDTVCSADQDTQWMLLSEHNAFLLLLVHWLSTIGWKNIAHWKQTEHLLEHAWTHIIHQVLHVKLSLGIVIPAQNSLNANTTRITGIQPQVRKGREIIAFPLSLYLFLFFSFLIPFNSDTGQCNAGFFDDGFLCISDLNSIPYRKNIVFLPNYSYYQLHSSDIFWDRWTSKTIFVSFFLVPSLTSSLTN